MEITVDIRQFEGLIPKLQAATKRTLASVVKQQAKLLLRGAGGGRDEGLIPYTPPPKGQQQGKAAVSRDINRVFITLAAVRKSVRDSKKRGLTPAFNRAIREGDHTKALALLKGTVDGTVQVKSYTAKRGGKRVSVNGYTASRPVSALGDNRLLSLQKIAPVPDRALHKSRRQGGGAVRRDRPQQIVSESGTLSQYIKNIQSRVGIMQAGWARAAAVLGVILPTFVQNAAKIRSSGGVILDLGSDSPSVTVENNTPGIRRAINSIMGRAIRGRAIRMQADLDRKLAAELEKMR